jgi:hypothetical protein
LTLARTKSILKELEDYFGPKERGIPIMGKRRGVWEKEQAA